MGMHWRKTRAVIFLKPSQKKSRKQWVQKFIDWDIEDFSWVYLDKAYIHLDDSRHTVYVTQSPNEVYHDDCMVLEFNSHLWLSWNTQGANVEG